MRWHIRSVRAQILLLVLVPVLSLFGLYLLTTGIAGKDALNLARARALKAATSQPVSNFLGQIDTERAFALIYLSAPSPANLARLRSQEAATGHVTAALHAALTAGSTLSNASSAVRGASAALLGDARGLPGLHSSIAARAVSRPQALAAYDKLIGDSFLLLNRVILTETSTPIVAQALALEQMAKSEELLQQENALLLADMAARRFPLADQHAFARLAGARTTLYEQTLPELDAAYQGFYRRDVSAGGYAALAALENTVIGGHAPRPPAVAPGAWERTVQGVSLELARAGAQAAGALDRQAEHEARVTDLRLILSGGVGLLAVVVSIIVSLLAGRRLVRELSGLRRAALDLADDRLPRMVDQLAVGLDVDPAGDSLDIPASTREIGQLRDAFVRVQQTAVEAAVGQARLREGIGEVFRNLARRSQSLLHRQLALLDRMERATEDPQELENLFRIDHLTTRMRRHAESLIVLAGQAPARGWRNPVPFVDVLRAAVAEVEDYTRVSVISVGDTGLAGPAVGDVIHLIAELAENATIFSPPNTPVVIQGGIVGQGFAVEIEDRGLGMSDDQLAEANRNLADPLPFDPAHTDQLGLLVAGQLAQRHDIQITLRRNPFGGITAIVLIPHSIVVAEGFELPDPVKALEGSVPGPGRHAGNGDNTDPELRPVTAAPGAGRPGPGPLPEDDVPPWVPRPFISPPLSSPPLADAPLAPPPPAPGLPRRVRQASLVPELRDAPLASGAEPDAGPPAPRSPEEARATMAAIQRGWQRGRSGFDPDPAPPSPAAGSPPSPAAGSPPSPAAGSPPSPTAGSPPGSPPSRFPPGFGPPPSSAAAPENTATETGGAHAPG